MGPLLGVLLFLVPGRLQSDEDAVIVGGYYPGYSMKIEQIPFDRYTHVFHPFVTADAEGKLKTTAHVPNSKLVKTAHGHGVKVILSLGGGGYELFPEIMKKEAAVERFVSGVMKIVGELDYDGIDLDWEHPRDAASGREWSRLMRLFRRKLDALGKEKGRALLLTTALPWGDWVGKFIDIEVVVGDLDFLNVMAYDGYGTWSKTAGCHSPLFPIEKDPHRYSMAEAMAYWEKKGVPKGKLCFGLPFYSYVFRDARPYGKIGGRVTAHGWSEVHELIRKEGWKTAYDGKAGTLWAHSPDGTTFLTADDPRVVEQKSRWAISNGYAGVFCWAMDHELMKDGSLPLSEAMLRGIKAAKGNR